MIQFFHVTKTYSHSTKPAVKDITFEIKEGERVGLIGANGSGKTTLFRLLMNFIIPDSGNILINGEHNLEKTRQWLGYVPERQEGLENFTPIELLNLAGQMHGIPSKELNHRIRELLHFAELEEVKDVLISDFSKGMLQRLQIILALIHQPPILLLDEPMSGLDPEGQREVQQILYQLTDKTLVYASHNLAEVEEFCSRVMILHQGELIKQLTLAEIEDEVYTFDIVSELLPLLKEKHFEYKILRESGKVKRIQIITTPQHFQELVAEVHQRGEQIQRLRSRGILEELYHTYVLSENASS